MAKKKIADEIPEIKEDLDEVLILAAYNRDFTMVQWALTMGADVNYQDSNGRTALAICCEYENTHEIVKFLIENGAEVNIKVEYSDYPLGYAAMYGRLNNVKLLLASGADVNQKGGYGRTALHYAVTPGDWSEHFLEITKLLLDHGADPTITHSGGDTPLLEALAYEDADIEIVKLLIEYGADLHAKDAYGGSALSRAAKRGRMDIIEVLWQQINSGEIEDKMLEKALLDAMKVLDNKEAMMYLLEQGKGKIREEFYTSNVLSHAARENDTHLIEYLLDCGIDLATADLHYALGDACYKGNFDVIKMLIELGADVNGGDYGASENPLMHAARHGHLEIAQYLLENGADIEARSYEGNTPLLFAAWEGQLEMIQFLIKKGADINSTNDMNWNALMQACLQGFYSLAKILVEKGSDVNLVDKEKGATPLMLVAHSCSKQIVKLLLENGADKSAKDKKGKTAGDYALTQGCGKIAEFITQF
jgi:ankyrin repeat protein